MHDERDSVKRSGTTEGLPDVAADTIENLPTSPAVRGAVGEASTVDEVLEVLRQTLPADASIWMDEPFANLLSGLRALRDSKLDELGRAGLFKAIERLSAHRDLLSSLGIWLNDLDNDARICADPELAATVLDELSGEMDAYARLTDVPRQSFQEIESYHKTALDIVARLGPLRERAQELLGRRVSPSRRETLAQSAGGADDSSRVGGEDADQRELVGVGVAKATTPAGTRSINTAPTSKAAKSAPTSRKKWNLRRHGHPWRNRDLGQLRRLARERTPIAAAAEQLGRSLDSVKSKASELGISFKGKSRAH